MASSTIWLRPLPWRCGATSAAKAIERGRCDRLVEGAKACRVDTRGEVVEGSIPRQGKRPSPRHDIVSLRHTDQDLEMRVGGYQRSEVLIADVAVMVVFGPDLSKGVASICPQVRPFSCRHHNQTQIARRYQSGHSVMMPRRPHHAPALGSTQLAVLVDDPRPLGVQCPRQDPGPTPTTPLGSRISSALLTAVPIYPVNAGVTTRAVGGAGGCASTAPKSQFGLPESHQLSTICQLVLKITPPLWSAT